MTRDINDSFKIQAMDAEIASKAPASHGHVEATTSAPGFMAASDKAKLNGIAEGATANASNASLRDRATHTGEQPVSTITGLQLALDGKAPTAHKHALNDLNQDGATAGQVPTWDDVVGWRPVTPPGSGGSTTTVEWDSVLSKPATFPPSAHTHAYADIPGLQLDLDGKAAAGHVHTWTQISEKPTTFPPASHGHIIGDVSGLQTVLDGKAAADHGHSAATTAAAGFMAAVDKTKLDGIAAGATQNATDTQLRDRATHTGTQPLGSVDGLTARLDAAPYYVKHGADGTVARPTAGFVIWIGTADPTNAVDDDLWLDTSAAA